MLMCEVYLCAHMSEGVSKCVCTHVRAWENCSFRFAWGLWGIGVRVRGQVGGMLTSGGYLCIHTCISYVPTRIYTCTPYVCSPAHGVQWTGRLSPCRPRGWWAGTKASFPWRRQEAEAQTAGSGPDGPARGGARWGWGGEPSRESPPCDPEILEPPQVYDPAQA